MIQLATDKTIQAATGRPGAPVPVAGALPFALPEGAAADVAVIPEPTDDRHEPAVPGSELPASPDPALIALFMSPAPPPNLPPQPYAEGGARAGSSPLPALAAEISAAAMPVRNAPDPGPLGATATSASLPPAQQSAAKVALCPPFGSSEAQNPFAAPSHERPAHARPGLPTSPDTSDMPEAPAPPAQSAPGSDATTIVRDRPPMLRTATPLAKGISIQSVASPAAQRTSPIAPKGDVPTQPEVRELTEQAPRRISREPAGPAPGTGDIRDTAPALSVRPHIPDASHRIAPFPGLQPVAVPAHWAVASPLKATVPPPEIAGTRLVRNSPPVHAPAGAVTDLAEPPRLEGAVPAFPTSGVFATTPALPSTPAPLAIISSAPLAPGASPSAVVEPPAAARPGPPPPLPGDTVDAAPPFSRDLLPPASFAGLPLRWQVSVDAAVAAPVPVQVTVLRAPDTPVAEPPTPVQPRPADPVSPAPVASLPGAIAFGAAVRVARPLDKRTPAVPLAPQLATVVPLATPAPAALSPAPMLDVRQEHWPRDMISHIESLRDAADAADTRIRLVPDALGQVEVDVRRDGDTLHVRFSAEQPQTRALLHDAQPRLAEAAEARGLRLGQASVDAGSAGQGQQRAPAPSQAPTARRSSPRAVDPQTPADDARIA